MIGDILTKWLGQELLTPSFPRKQGVCRGPLLSWEQYKIPVQSWGYQDTRLMPHGNLPPAHVAEFTRTMEHESLLQSQWCVKF